MESIIKIASQILFALSAIVFVIYSIVAIYSLNAYGRSKSTAASISIVYSAVVAGILAWAVVIIVRI